MLVLVLVLVLKDSFKTNFKSIVLVLESLVLVLEPRVFVNIPALKTVFFLKDKDQDED